jgi:excisionase family DNA binding protein
MPAQDFEDLLRPREVAGLFGVRTTTIARWAREGKLTPLRTPGGHRRYNRAEIQAMVAAEAEERATRYPERQRMIEDAVRLYDQGWSIRQVAKQFDCGYGAMRRLLLRHGTLRNRRSAGQSLERDSQAPLSGG